MFGLLSAAFFSVVVTGGFCPSSTQGFTICKEEQTNCTLLSLDKPKPSNSCNQVCASFGAVCLRAYSGLNAVCSFGNVSATTDCSFTDKNMRCECVEKAIFVSKGNNTGCRAYNDQDSGARGCLTPDGCYYDLYYDIPTLDDCKNMCAGDDGCVGIEWGFGEAPRRCEIWRFKKGTGIPFFHNVGGGYECISKLPGKPCFTIPPIPKEFKPVDPGCFPLPHGRTCLLECGGQTLPVEDVSMICNEGNISVPSGSLCQAQKSTDVVDLVRVTFALQFDINATCGNMVTMASRDDVRTIALAFAANVKSALNMTVAPAYVSAAATIGGMNATLLFKTAPEGKPTAIDYVREFLRQKENLTSFNISSINGICTIDTDVMRLYISFTSLFAYLKGLPDWMLFAVFGALLLFIIIFLLINRKSDHPFAMLGAVISIINLGARVVFIMFLWNIYEMLSAQGIDAFFFYWCFYAAIVVAAVTLTYNLISTIILLRYHAAKNADAFAMWGSKHCFGITVLMSLCALNPANFMIFCSSTFNLDLFKGPISHSAQKQFQFAGIISVLMGDLPPIVLNVLTLFEVDENQQLAWDGGTNSIILPLIISVASIFVGVIRRICFICVKPQAARKLEESELVYEPEPELVTAPEPTPEPAPAPAPAPKIVPFLAPMKQMEEGWAGVTLGSNLVASPTVSKPSFSPDDQQESEDFGMPAEETYMQRSPSYFDQSAEMQLLDTPKASQPHSYHE